jgi:hypothetical protein
VVQVSGGATLARTSSVAPSIKIKSNFRGNRVDTIFRAGLAPCSFFRDFFKDSRKKFARRFSRFDTTNPIQRSFELAAEHCEKEFSAQPFAHDARIKAAVIADPPTIFFTANGFSAAKGSGSAPGIGTGR